LSVRGLTAFFDFVPRPPEPLPTLLADELSRTERLVQSVLGIDPVSADTAAKPRGMRLLVGEAGGIHRPEFRREKLRVAERPMMRCVGELPGTGATP
jgi:hypothetical protein